MSWFGKGSKITKLVGQEEVDRFVGMNDDIDYILSKSKDCKICRALAGLAKELAKELKEKDDKA